MKMKLKSLFRIIAAFLFQFSMAAIILVFISIASIAASPIAASPESICLGKAVPDWTPISGNQYNMIAFGHIHMDGVDPGQGTLILYSFGQRGEVDCRSKCDIGLDGAYYATIRGNARGEIISFKLYDCKRGKAYDLKDTITFEMDAVREDFDIR